MANRKKLLKQLHDGDPKKRYDAVMALGQTGDLELLDDLDKVANLDDDARVRHLAGQAVEVFSTLRRRRMERERAAMMAGDDGTFEWPELAQEKILKEREHTAAGAKEEEWSYVDSKRRQMERLTEEEREQLLIAEERERRRRARARPRRIIRILIFFIVLIGVVYAAYLYLNRVEQPDSRVEALEDLQSWLRSQQDALLGYSAAFANNAVDCEAAKAVSVPAAPEWVVEVTPPPFDGMDTIISNLNEIQEYLEHSQSSVETVCAADVTIVNAADVPDYGPITGEQIRGQRLALTVASNIDQEIKTEQAADGTEPTGTLEPTQP